MKRERERERERELLLVSLGVRGKEIACLDAAIGPQACLSAVTDEKEREREIER